MDSTTNPNESQLLTVIRSRPYREVFDRIEALEPLVTPALDIPGNGWVRFALVDGGQEPWNMRYFACEIERMQAELNGNIAAFIAAMRELAALTEGQLLLFDSDSADTRS